MNTGPPMQCVTPQSCLLIGGAVTAGSKMRRGEHLDDRRQSACRLDPEMGNQPNRDRRSKEPLLTSTEPSLSLRRVNPPV